MENLESCPVLSRFCFISRLMSACVRWKPRCYCGVSSPRVQHVCSPTTKGQNKSLPWRKTRRKRLIHAVTTKSSWFWIQQKHKDALYGLGTETACDNCERIEISSFHSALCIQSGWIAYESQCLRRRPTLCVIRKLWGNSVGSPGSWFQLQHGPKYSTSRDRSSAHRHVSGW